jgi:hypothetical protein
LFNKTYFTFYYSKVVEEKEKEAEIFYRSSDSEVDEECNEVMEVAQVNIINENENEINAKNTHENDDDITIANTQKLTQDDIQESHNKREILQQRSLDFGVPRKLFMEDENDTEEIENVQEFLKCSNEKKNESPNNLALLKKKYKEVKTGIRESSIPRKLFTNEDIDMDIDMDIDNNDNDESILEEKVTKNEKLLETDEKTDSLENIVLENSTEEIVLNISETEFDSSENTKAMKSSNISDLSVQNKDHESITISETPCISNKELSKSNKTSIISTNTKDIDNKNINTDECKQSDNSNESLDKNKNNNIQIIDQDVLEMDFSLPFELDETSKKSCVKEKILANVLKVKPMIKGSPGSIIDFASSGQMKEGVSQLLNRFARHSTLVKMKVEEVSEVKIISTEGEGNDIKVIEETLPFKRTIVEDEDNKELKPGEKLKKLREDLKRKIATIRHEEWKQKEEYEKEDEEEFEDKSDDYYADLPDEEEILEDEESSESEPEENDVLIIDKQKSKCEFAEEEAEETDNEDVDDLSENEEDDEDEESQGDVDDNGDDDVDDEGNKENKNTEEQKYKNDENVCNKVIIQ